MRVVLIRLSALGDIVHTWPLADALRRSQLCLSWVVEQPLLPLVEGHPAVDEVVSVATHRWRRQPLASSSRGEMAAVRRHFRELRPELCIDAQGVLKSAVVTRWTGAGRRVGLALPWRRERLAGLAYTETVAGSLQHTHVVATNLELVRAAGATPPQEVPAPSGRWLLNRLEDHDPPGSWQSSYAVLLPGAGHPSKVLPVGILVEIADALAREGLPVVVVWGPGEQERAAKIVSRSGDGVTLAPATGLADLTVVLGRAALVIGGDTGPVHLAASLEVPTIGVFLTTSEARNRPLGANVKVISATAEPGPRPTGSAKARPVRPVGSEEVVGAALALIGAGR